MLPSADVEEGLGVRAEAKANTPQTPLARPSDPCQAPGMGGGSRNQLLVAVRLLPFLPTMRGGMNYILSSGNGVLGGIGGTTWRRQEFVEDE